MAKSNSSKPCRYYRSKRGCGKGDACRFVHDEDVKSPTLPSVEQNDSAGDADASSGRAWAVADGRESLRLPADINDSATPTESASCEDTVGTLELSGRITSLVASSRNVVGRLGQISDIISDLGRETETLRKEADDTQMLAQRLKVELNKVTRERDEELERLRLANLRLTEERNDAKAICESLISSVRDQELERLRLTNNALIRERDEARADAEAILASSVSLQIASAGRQAGGTGIADRAEDMPSPVGTSVASSASVDRIGTKVRAEDVSSPVGMSGASSSSSLGRVETPSPLRTSDQDRIGILVDRMGRSEQKPKDRNRSASEETAEKQSKKLSAFLVPPAFPTNKPSPVVKLPAAVSVSISSPSSKHRRAPSPPAKLPAAVSVSISETPSGRQSTSPIPVEIKRNMENIQNKKEDAPSPDNEEAERLQYPREEDEKLSSKEKRRIEKAEGKKHLEKILGIGGSDKTEGQPKGRSLIGGSSTRIMGGVSKVKPNGGTRSRKSKPPPPSNAIELAQLSLYLCPGSDAKTPTASSIIFDFLQCPSNVEDGRQLLRCEVDMSFLKRDVVVLERKKETAEKRIITETDQKRVWEAELKDTESNLRYWRKAKLKVVGAGRDGKVRGDGEAQRQRKLAGIEKTIENLKQQIQDVPKHIAEAQKEATELGVSIESKNVDISTVRNNIARLKGFGLQEVDDFGINNTTQRGHTFLMIAAQNNDLETAQLCLDLGADPDERGPGNSMPPAVLFAYYFGFSDMVSLIREHGGTYPKREVEVWDRVLRADAVERGVNWDNTLKIAEKAAIPTETLLESAESLDSSEDTRMHPISKEDHKREFKFFEACLAIPFNSSSMRRTCLLNKAVYDWFSESNQCSQNDFISFLDKLRPGNASSMSCHRRAVIGTMMAKRYEVLCSKFHSALPSLVILFTPFVTSPVEGVADIGVLVWAVCNDDDASLNKTLIDTTDFLRHKVEDNEQFPPTVDAVMELGRDMHLLDLHSTSIYTSSSMELYLIDVDDSGLEKMKEKDFAPTKRITHHEQMLNKALFLTSEEEMIANDGIISSHRVDMSTNLSGGAGTGKTLLLIKKVIREDPDRKILVVARLPHLMSQIRVAVEAERDTMNVTFTTYNELLAHLARQVTPPNEAEHFPFPTFSKVEFGENADDSVNFLEFISDFLESGERQTMKANLIEPMTLWTHFRTIKSHVSCATTKEPLSQEEYLALNETYGLDKSQRSIVYAMFARYRVWLGSGGHKWDEADRVLYVLKFGPRVFSDDNFLSWRERAYYRGEIDLLEDDGETPLRPFFFHGAFVDEVQDFTMLDLALFLRMSSCARSLFLGGDPAQSVELGVRMQANTVNDVFHKSLGKGQKKNKNVKDVLQEFSMRTNHRTHAQNLELSKAVRKLLTRSFGVPSTNENALITGPIPEAMLLSSIDELAEKSIFKGGSIVFLAPDEDLKDLRSALLRLGIKNDVFGIRESKGLEFNDVAIINLFGFVENLGNAREWENWLRWLYSSTTLKITDSIEMVAGKRLEDCDYNLSNPELLDQGMMAYTALTRARNHLYLIEIEGTALKKKGVSRGLAAFAFRRLEELELVKLVHSIDEGFVEMTPAQHKARGVLLVTKAIELSRISSATIEIRAMFQEALDRFRSDKGNDKQLFDQCTKHMEISLMKHKLIHIIKSKFFDKAAGCFKLDGKFADVLQFEEDASKFFNTCISDPFLLDEVYEVRVLMEEVFLGTPYEVRFRDICSTIRDHEVL